MRAELQTSDVPKVAFYRDPRIRAIFYQLLVVSLVFLGGYILVSNTMANLAKLGVAGGFAFLDRPSGFDIGQTLIEYSSSNTFGQAFIVGFLNTILVAVVGIFFATIIGFTMGIARLSHNWLVSTLATIYIETVRNIPLLLQLLLVYAVIIHALPQPRESGVLFNSVLLNTGGLFLPKPLPQPGFGVVAIIWLLALLAIPFVLRWAAKKRELTGQPVKIWPVIARAAGADPDQLLRCRTAAWARLPEDGPLPPRRRHGGTARIRGAGPGPRDLHRLRSSPRSSARASSRSARASGRRPARSASRAGRPCASSSCRRRCA